jgi:hypothetical protein
MKLLIVFALVFVISHDVRAEGWNKRNDPSVFGSNYNYNFDNLNLNGSLAPEMIPWSDTYWPSFMSGIAHRWMSNNPNDFDYSPNSLKKLQSMEMKDLMLLSPAEKYDIFMGRYDYPTVKSEWMRTSPQDAKWEGICHGWAPAALMYRQPSPVTLKNKDGISIPFGSSDVKALLSYFVAEYNEQQSSSVFVAERCNYDLKANPKYENTSDCMDINAGSFHVIMSNQLGSGNPLGYVIDRDRSIQVWNQPVFKYQSSVLGNRPPSPGAAPGTATEVEVVTILTYGKETVPQWEAHPTYPVSEKYYYFLELDQNGNIIGGSHESWDRPDFQWMNGITPFNGYFAQMQQIYQASIGNSTELEARTEKLLTEFKMPATKTHAHMETTMGALELSKYQKDHRQSWTIAPPHASSITLSFKSFKTHRHQDKLKIYEGANGEGALIAVLHGDLDNIPKEITVNGPSAYILFKSQNENPEGGFSLSYSSA